MGQCYIVNGDIDCRSKPDVIRIINEHAIKENFSSEKITLPVTTYEDALKVLFTSACELDDNTVYSAFDGTYSWSNFMDKGIERIVPYLNALHLYIEDDEGTSEYSIKDNKLVSSYEYLDELDENEEDPDHAEC